MTDRSYVPASWLSSIRTFLCLCKVPLYLGALTLANIVSDNGYYIMDWALTGLSKAKLMIPWPN
eukprot:7456483-Ditylum_brightwellii.AAC.1